LGAAEGEIIGMEAGVPVSGDWILRQQRDLKAGDIFLFNVGGGPPFPAAEGRMAWLLLNPKTKQRLMIRFKAGMFEMVRGNSAVQEGDVSNYDVWVWEWTK
jgi:hypothetical protein